MSKGKEQTSLACLFASSLRARSHGFESRRLPLTLSNLGIFIKPFTKEFKGLVLTASDIAYLKI